METALTVCRACVRAPPPLGLRDTTSQSLSLQVEGMSASEHSRALEDRKLEAHLLCPLQSLPSNPLSPSFLPGLCWILLTSCHQKELAQQMVGDWAWRGEPAAQTCHPLQLGTLCSEALRISLSLLSSSFMALSSLLPRQAWTPAPFPPCFSSSLTASYPLFLSVC